MKNNDDNKRSNIKRYTYNLCIMNGHMFKHQKMTDRRSLFSKALDDEVQKVTTKLLR